jgi:hypothetical protein
VSSSVTNHIADTLNRAQLCFETSVDHTAPLAERRDATAWFMYHVVTTVLLEHIRRLNPATAEQLIPWLLDEGGIFEGGYAGELVHRWREQLAAGAQLDPIGPDLKPEGS